MSEIHNDGTYDRSLRQIIPGTKLRFIFEDRKDNLDLTLYSYREGVYLPIITQSVFAVRHSHQEKKIRIIGSLVCEEEHSAALGEMLKGLQQFVSRQKNRPVSLLEFELIPLDIADLNTSDNKVLHKGANILIEEQKRVADTTDYDYRVIPHLKEVEVPPYVHTN